MGYGRSTLRSSTKMGVIYCPPEVFMLMYLYLEISNYPGRKSKILDFPFLLHKGKIHSCAQRLWAHFSTKFHQMQHNQGVGLAIDAP